MAHRKIVIVDEPFKEFLEDMKMYVVNHLGEEFAIAGFDVNNVLVKQMGRTKVAFVIGAGKQYSYAVSTIDFKSNVVDELVATKMVIDWVKKVPKWTIIKDIYMDGVFRQLKRMEKKREQSFL